ncbi:MAG: hypothetical protein ACLTDR_06220 [Adlercreutzia equolifaciens]
MRSVWAPATRGRAHRDVETALAGPATAESGVARTPSPTTATPAPSWPWRPCAPPMDEFFDTTMVMDEDPEVRANRLKLSNRFANVVRPRGRLLPDGEK